MRNYIYRGSSWKDPVSMQFSSSFRIDSTYDSFLTRGFRVAQDPDTLITRGSAWDLNQLILRSVYFYRCISVCSYDYLGFRVVE